MSMRRQSLEDRAFDCHLFVARKGTQVRFFLRPSPFHRRGAVYTAASEALAAAWVDGVAYGRGDSPPRPQQLTFEEECARDLISVAPTPPIDQRSFLERASVRIEPEPPSTEPDEPTLFDVTP